MGKPMWCAWLRFTSDDDSFSFRLFRGGGSADEEKMRALGDLLFDGLLEVTYVKRLAEKYGETALGKYLEARGFRGKLGKRVGDFGEVLAGAAICENESLTQLVQKLRYRERADWPMRLTDVFSVRVEGADITAFCFTSVKSGVTHPAATVGVEGYKQLLDDSKSEHPEILHFVSENLFRQDLWEELLRLEQAMTSDSPTPKIYRLALIFDRDQWREDILTELGESEQTLDDFVVYAVLLERMRDIVEASYSLATERCFA